MDTTESLAASHRITLWSVALLAGLYLIAVALPIEAWLLSAQSFALWVLLPPKFIPAVLTWMAIASFLGMIGVLFGQIQYDPIYQVEDRNFCHKALTWLWYSSLSLWVLAITIRLSSAGYLEASITVGVIGFLTIFAIAQVDFDKVFDAYAEFFDREIDPQIRKLEERE